MKVSLISLGCSKNLVDSEVLMGKLSLSGAEITADTSEADVIVINTCGFIEDAKRESIEVILDAIETGKRVLVMGCLVERYMEELRKELPEVEEFFPTQSWDRILGHLGIKDRTRENIRALSTPRSYAYLKIAEGCNRLCSFCSIPAIRGRHRSRTIEEILREAQDLAERGVRELNIISQDTTYYGRDLYRENKLIELLRRLEKADGIEWIRLLYLYPTEISDELLSFIAGSEKVLPYFDIPLQHISTRVLHSMRRGYDEREVRNLIERIKRELSDVVLRTTLIVGFPAEEEGDFKKLLSFVEEGHFHWLGVFTYSHEEGTHAYTLGDSIPPEVKRERLQAIMDTQQGIMEEHNRKFVGKSIKVLMEDEKEGRAWFQAPEVDGKVILSVDRVSGEGIAKVRIKEVVGADLEGILEF